MQLRDSLENLLREARLRLAAAEEAYGKGSASDEYWRGYRTACLRSVEDLEEAVRVASELNV